jgi:hypothetical protein
MATLATPSVPVSWGELIDKITILEIKRERIGGPAACANVEHEWARLRAIAAPALTAAGLKPLCTALKHVNLALWDIEDAIRRLDAAGDFGREFVALAQAVYRRNDERARIKRRINDALDSEFVEEKSYAAFAQARASVPPLITVVRSG